MLGTAHVTSSTHFDIEQAGFAHPLEVGPHRVGVQAERFGDVGGGERPWRTSQLEVDRVAGVVTERLEQVELRSPDERRDVRLGVA